MIYSSVKADTFSTVGPGKDYANLVTWEAGEQANLTSPCTAEVYAFTEDMGDTQFDIDGWTTYPTAYINIEVPRSERHYYIMKSSYRYGAFYIDELHVRVNGIRLELNRFDTTARVTALRCGATSADKDHRISNCEIINSSFNARVDWQYPSCGFDPSSLGVTMIWNCEFWNWGNALLEPWQTEPSTYVAYNNTIYECGRTTTPYLGAVNFNGDSSMYLYLKNNLVTSATKCYLIGASGMVYISSKNISSDDTSPDVEMRNIDVNFVNEEVSLNTDLRLAEGATSYRGIDISSDPDGWVSPSLDILEYPRGLTGYWFVGANRWNDPVPVIFKKGRKKLITF